MKQNYLRKFSTFSQVNSHHKKNTRQRKSSNYLRQLAAGWLILQTCFLTTPALSQQKPKHTLTYGEFLEKLADKQVQTVELDETNQKARVTLKGEGEKQTPKNGKII